MKVYVTKYALSTGVTLQEGEIWGDHGKYFQSEGRYLSLLLIGRDCYAKREDAVAAVERMQAKKIASLTKQLAAIRKIHPEEVVPMEAA